MIKRENVIFGKVDAVIMCGIYHVNRELEYGIESLMKMVNRERRAGAVSQRIPEIRERDVRPTDEAPILSCNEDGMSLRTVRWGLPGFQKGQVIFNARCETALERPMFRDGIRQGRIVIPARSFYEWNRRKEKNTFERTDGKILYLAGFCRGNGTDERFVILTTAANASMIPVHDRMPLILEESEIEPWLFEEAWTESLLRKVPGVLSRKAEYEQLSLF